MRAKELRAEARKNLTGKWQKAIIISIIYAAIIFVLALIVEKVSILGIAQLVIMPPLTYGIAYSYYHLKNGDEVGYVDFLTVGFKNFGRSWSVAWEIIKKMWWCFLLAMIPLVIMLALIGGAIFASVGSSSLLTNKYYRAPATYEDVSYRTTYDYDYELPSSYARGTTRLDADTEMAISALSGVAAGTIIGAVIALIVYIVILVFVAIRGLLYALTYYIAVIKENDSPSDAIKESETLMRGNRGRYFCLMLSFFGWYFLAGFASGLCTFMGDTISQIVAEVAIAIIAPYTAFATIAFYENVAKENNVSVPSSEPVKTVEE